jgi:hypothetical protein
MLADQAAYHMEQEHAGFSDASAQASARADSRERVERPGTGPL